jgi:hypothetical protein
VRTIRIGTLLFDGIDQIDVTGPFEVLSRLPNATHRLYALVNRPVTLIAAQHGSDLHVAPAIPELRLAVNSKLRGCDLVQLRIGQLVINAAARHRATIVQQKTHKPVQFKLTD